MPTTRAPRAARKRPNRYHHGDLRRALLEQAVRTIAADGVSALTLRGVGESLGVSRTALYRHFAHKSALLEAVAADGFRRLTAALVAARVPGRDLTTAFLEQGRAYVRFAIENPSHYRVMFGGVVSDVAVDSEARREGACAFGALVELLVEMQQAGAIRADDPMQLGRYVWASVHGVATLVIDGQLAHQQADVPAFVNFSVERMSEAIAASDRAKPGHDAP